VGDHEYYDDRHAAADDQPRPRSFANPQGLSVNEERKRAAEYVRRYNERHVFFGRLYGSASIDIPEIQVNRGGIRWPTQDEGEMMRTSQDLITEAENLRQQAERLEAIAEQRAKYGEDPFKNGTVLKVDMKYRTGNRSYAYAVIKVGGRFYLSGRMSAIGTGSSMPATSDASRGLTWENFVAWLAQGDATVWRARSLEQVL